MKKYCKQMCSLYQSVIYHTESGEGGVGADVKLFF